MVAVEALLRKTRLIAACGIVGSAVVGILVGGWDRSHLETYHLIGAASGIIVGIMAGVQKL